MFCSEQQGVGGHLSWMWGSLWLLPKLPLPLLGLMARLAGCQHLRWRQQGLQGDTAAQVGCGHAHTHVRVCVYQGCLED
jgi:hypothetical protein